MTIGPDARLRLANEPNDDNYHIVAKLAFDLAEQGWWEFHGQRFSIETESELILALKDECARLRIDRGNHREVDSDVIYRAAASEWFKRTHPEISGRQRATA